jgi:hypothetical protein
MALTDTYLVGLVRAAQEAELRPHHAQLLAFIPAHQHRLLAHLLSPSAAGTSQYFRE